MLLLLAALAAAPAGPVQLFVDRALIESLDKVELRLHAPRRAEVALHFDKRWEGPTATYVTVLQDGPKFRAYYRGWTGADQDATVCYAESRNGIDWTKPELGLIEWDGSKQNNIVWRGIGSHNFVPFVNARPGAPSEERYLAIGRGIERVRALYAFASPDGLRWRLLQDEPVFTDGAFDSQNVSFWDTNTGKYVCYYRVFRDGTRTIARAESADFRNWCSVGDLTLDGAERFHLYTNAITPYFRAPNLYFSFPMAFSSPAATDSISAGLFPRRSCGRAVILATGETAAT
jgi:hypothetical protein